MNATTELTLVSPYLQLSKTFFERLKDATHRGVKVTIIFGKDELKRSEKEQLVELNNLKLLFFENLHAKCYFNEKNMVITSMNMYEFSEKNNREMGVLVSKITESDFYNAALTETQSIISSSKIIELTPKRSLSNTKQEIGEEPLPSSYLIDSPRKGYCIRCKTDILYNSKTPYCSVCYSVWSQFENLEYHENYCHSCGKQVDTTMLLPLCFNCFNKESGGSLSSDMLLTDIKLSNAIKKRLNDHLQSEVNSRYLDGALVLKINQNAYRFFIATTSKMRTLRLYAQLTDNEIEYVFSNKELIEQELNLKVELYRQNRFRDNEIYAEPISIAGGSNFDELIVSEKNLVEESICTFVEAIEHLRY